MLSKFAPELNKVYFINRHSALHILEGTGLIEVDFKSYRNWGDKIIFLEKGQYIKFLSPDFLVRKIEFDKEERFRNENVRVLFKHLVSLGYINFKECEDCQKFLSDSVFSDNISDIIDISSKQWYWQNPFQANEKEYHLIFDAKEIIDQQYKNHLSNQDLASLLKPDFPNVHKLFTDKIGLTIRGLLGKKRLLESQKEVAFSNKNVQEIAYEFGYKDPAYFSRQFKSNTGKTPLEFREQVHFERKDLFVQELYQLIQHFHAEQRQASFYADELNMSVKTLSKKVREKLHLSLGQLIRQELIRTAKKRLLEENISVKEIAFGLGFEEANHFSAFFKHYAGMPPTDFRNKKYHP